MRVENKILLEELAGKHADVIKPLQKWLDIMEEADFANHNALKRVFPSADFVGNGRYVFNIKGNKYRLVAVVVFVMGVLYVRFCGTHAEYDKIKDIKNI